MRALNRTNVHVPERPIAVLQFGGGNFLRGFVDWMIQTSNDAGVTDLGVAVVHVTPQPDPSVESLRAQDGLFHVSLQGVQDGAPVRETTLVDCVQTVVTAHEEFDRYRELYLDEHLRVIVSNTTEAGIAYVEGDDLTARPPLSFPAKVTALLYDRFRHFDGDPDKGLVIVPCELIEDNGTTLREYVLRHAEAAGLEPEFAEWVRSACSFADTLVDRIVPGFPHDEIDRIQQEIGFADRLVVKGEYFHVWAIGGDARVREALPLDRAGLNVKFMDDIRPFREQKVRILNGAHTSMSAIGLGLGIATVYSAYADDDLHRYVTRLVFDEVLSTIDGDRRELEAFAAAILERFANPYLEHHLADIALNAVSKWRTRNLPVYVDLVRAGRPAPLTAFSLAAVLLLQAGRLAGEEFVPRDDEQVLELLRTSYDAADLGSWVRGAVDGLDLAVGLSAEQTGALVKEAAGFAESIMADGARAAVEKLLGEQRDVLAKAPSQAAARG